MENSQRKPIIAIAGASGLIGSALVRYLNEYNFHIKKFVRTTPQNENEIFIHPQLGEIEFEKLNDVDGVINLSGESIANRRWNDSQKKLIIDSRVLTTRTIVQGMKKCSRPPNVFVSASATGFYGNRPNEKVDEESSKGTGFLADVCDLWESEAIRANEYGARTCIVRIGIVLTNEGGALPKLLTPIKFGVGGWFGSGEQIWSWITREDLIRVFHFALIHQEVDGIINAVSPHSVRNRDFVKILADVLRRPAFFPVPSILLKMMLGEMAKPLLLDSVDVVPKKLQKHNFSFETVSLQEAIKKL